MRHAPGVGGRLLNADLLYLPALVEDVLVRQNPFGAWSLTPAPYLFPDGVLYAISRLVAGNILTAVFLAAAAQVAAAAAAGLLALKALTPAGARAAALVPAAIGLVAAAGLHGWPLAEHLWWISYHAGVCTLVLGGSALLARRGRLATAGLAAWCAAGGASDGLFVLAFGAPALAVGVLAATRSRRAAGLNVHLLVAGGSSFLGAALGHLLLPPVQHREFALRLERVPETLAAMATDLGALDLRGSATFVVAAALLSAGWRAAPRIAHGPIVRVWVLGCALTVLAIVATGNLVQSNWPRYLLWPVVCAALLALLLVPWQRRRWATGASAALLLGAFSVSTGAIASGATSSHAPPAWPRETAGCLDVVAAREDVGTVLADYWNAKPLTLFSKAGLRVVSFTQDLRGPYVWIVSRAWYEHTDRAGLVVLEGLDAATVFARFGEPAERVTCPGATVLVYRGAGRDRLRDFLQEAQTRVGL